MSSARRRSANTTATNSTRAGEGLGQRAESLFRKAVGDGPQSVFCARPYGQFRGTTQAMEEIESMAVDHLSETAMVISHLRIVPR